MAKYSPIREIMESPLPSIGQQKRLSYRTDINEVTRLYKTLNYYIFDYQLAMPELEVLPRCRKYWGMCYGSYDIPARNRSSCKIRLMDKWYCKQWLVTTLAHEMCHQYQWDVEGVRRLNRGQQPIMSHGPSFFVFRERLKKHGICLKSAHSKRKWFRHQNLFKC